MGFNLYKRVDRFIEGVYWKEDMECFIEEIIEKNGKYFIKTTSALHELNNDDFICKDGTDFKVLPKLFAETEYEIYDRSGKWTYKSFKSLNKLVDFINDNKLEHIDFQITSRTGFTGLESSYILVFKER